MPVIRYVPQAPADLIVQGEQMRIAAMMPGLLCHVAPAPATMAALLEGGTETILLNTPNLVEGEQTFPPMMVNGTLPRRPFLDPFDGTMVRGNACIATPCGALYPTGIGGHMMDAVFYESTVRWLASGITKDGVGSPLGNCRVVVFDVGQLAKGAPAVVAETMSDGAGAYAVEVPQNTGLQAIAYKSGIPDLAGVTVNTLVPVANG